MPASQVEEQASETAQNLGEIIFRATNYGTKGPPVNPNSVLIISLTAIEENSSLRM